MPSNSLVVHEWHDHQRSGPLIEKLADSGILRNPPIIASLLDGTERYMVLDGANRTTAISEMGIPHIIAQVVQPASDAVDMRTWNHVLWEWDPQAFLDAIRALDAITVEEIDEDEGLRKLWNRLALVWLQTPDGRTYLGSCDEGLDAVEWLGLLNNIVEIYKANARLDRTMIRKITSLKDAYQDLCALVVFPPFTIDEVLELTSKGHLFPSGVTRFAVSPRALRIDFPLNDLSSDKTLEEKNEALQKWTQERLAKKGVRFYAEATVLFDE